MSKTGYSKEELNNAYKDGFAIGTIIQLKAFREQLLDRKIDLEDTYKQSGHHSIINRISELNTIISMIEQKVYELSPSDCDW